LLFVIFLSERALSRYSGRCFLHFRHLCTGKRDSAAMEAAGVLAFRKETLMRILRPFAVLVVVLSLGISQASASQPVRETAGRDSKPALSFFAGLGALWMNFWTKEGCRMDPLGRCVTSATADAGCRMDPWGRCIDVSKADAGCRIDPLGGGCLPN
jgi:hypothetical protein